MKEKISKLEIKFAAMEATQKQLEKRIETQDKTINNLLHRHESVYEKIKKLESEIHSDRIEYEVERLFKENMEKITPKTKTKTPYKIKEITKDHIQFTNGDTIHHDHNQDCCENNYADFEQIDDLAKQYEFRGELLFEKAACGFRFGDSRCMFFVPCYSEQNGYYSAEVTIYLNDKEVLCSECDVKLY